MDITTKLRQFVGPRTEDNYNQFFNPNICHVCKLPSQNELTPCYLCGMIFYCSTEHELIHQMSHIEVCVLRTKANVENCEPDWELDSRRFYSEKDWRESRTTLMLQIKTKMPRNLKPYEIEMFVCAKSCLICHQQINLRACDTCYSANYCDEHESDFKKKHKSICTDLLVLLNLNIATINDELYLQHINLNIAECDALFDDMFTFVDVHIKPCTYTENYMQNVSLPWNQNCYMYSDYISGSMTIFSLIKEFKDCFVFRQNYPFTIHFIAASSVDIMTLPLWEMLLHIDNKWIKDIRIVLIAPENDCELSELYNCSRCRKRNQKLYVENVRVSHDNYIRTSLYKQANVIVAFQPEFCVGGALLDILMATQEDKCPFIFTAKSQSKVKESMNKIQEVMGANKGYLFAEENKFRSYRPYRDYETGGIYYCNAYSVIYLR